MCFVSLIKPVNYIILRYHEAFVIIFKQCKRKDQNRIKRSHKSQLYLVNALDKNLEEVMRDRESTSKITRIDYQVKPLVT